MIDTNTVNFAINKISQAIGAAVPTMKNVSESYVKFVVTQQYVYTIGWLIGSILCVVAWLPFYFTARKEDKYGNKGFDEAYFFAPSIVCGILFAIFSICFICFAMDSFLAFNNPEMFTVNQIIENTKQK